MTTMDFRDRLLTTDIRHINDTMRALTEEFLIIQDFIKHQFGTQFADYLKIRGSFQPCSPAPSCPDKTVRTPHPHHPHVGSHTKETFQYTQSQPIHRQPTTKNNSTKESTYSYSLPSGGKVVSDDHPVTIRAISTAVCNPSLVEDVDPLGETITGIDASPYDDDEDPDDLNDFKQQTEKYSHPTQNETSNSFSNSTYDCLSSESSHHLAQNSAAGPDSFVKVEMWSSNLVEEAVEGSNATPVYQASHGLFNQGRQERHDEDVEEEGSELTKKGRLHFNVNSQSYEINPTSYTCSICNSGRRYTNITAFKRHVKAHTKTFSCPGCDRMFGRKDHRDLHVKNVHPIF